MNLYVLRHGQTDYNVQGKFQGQVDVLINEMGINQAKKVAEELKNVVFDKVYSSPLKRALKTAEIVLNYNSKKTNIIIDERIIERSFGKLEGKGSVANFEQKIEEYQIETIDSLKKRVYEFLDEIMIKCKNCDNILVVTHAGISRIIEGYFNPSFNYDEKVFLKNGEYKKYIVK